MQPLKSVVSLAVIAGLVAAAPAVAKSEGGAKRSGHSGARASGGDIPPILPSIVRVRINRGEKALDRAADYIDRDKSDKAVASLKNARRNMYAAWKGAVYVIQHAPPPPAEDAKLKAHKSDDPTGPVYADPVTTAVAVLGFQHDTAAAAISMMDGAKGSFLGAVNTTVFAALDRRDSAIQFIHSLPAPPAEDARASVRAKAAQDDGAPTFDVLMPGVAVDVQDEVQQIQGTLQDGAVVPTGKRILNDALLQDFFTANTINTFWPPVTEG